jgi:UDP-N-acetylglucosamine diphosphorylase/glucosamine-1-phosphate N-acetyltransferase
MNIVFIEPFRNQLLPFTYTKPVSELRCGILKMNEKWRIAFPEASISHQTEEYLQKTKWPLSLEKDNYFINASVFPNSDLIGKIKQLEAFEGLYHKEEIIAYRSSDPDHIEKKIQIEQAPMILKNTWDIFALNHKAIEQDFKVITKDKQSESIPEHVLAIHPERIFIEPGAKLINGTLNATDGPIYIGKNAEIMESVNIRGPFALCEHATVKMNAKIYTGTTIGPHSKVGGEVSNSVIQGYSNKGHDGFLGNSVIGEWCNLGADTNTSNLKNNYASVKLWDYQKEGFKDTGLQFCGLMMGDHSKCGINTMFNTGTVVGVSANIYGAGFPRNFIPSFSWGGSSGFITYKFSKATEVAKIVMKRRNIEFDQNDEDILNHIFEITQKFRKR